jgi:hypothetical protein
MTYPLGFRKLVIEESTSGRRNVATKPPNIIYSDVTMPYAHAINPFVSHSFSVGLDTSGARVHLSSIAVC